MTNTTENNQAGTRIRVRGQVQGVGFRPAVWRLANEFQFSGRVLNDGNGVQIDLWGDNSLLDSFTEALHQQCPPLARIDSLQQEPLSGIPTTDFHIVASQQTENHTGVVPDAASCPECIADLNDPENRRYRYPFTNCTNCGPRLSIIDAIPYDRANTSMVAFNQCPDCQAEYDAADNRRFHAQPNACPECGPQIWLEPSASHIEVIDEIERAQILLKQGYILTIKGIGGFHLVCDASNDEVVSRLRQRKQRYVKPFALMAADLDMIGSYCELNDTEKALLTSPQAPIVLLKRKVDSGLAAELAPNQKTLGFMLAYTPLHHLLLQDLAHPLVMTSGNLSDNPQWISNDQVRSHLGGIADYALMHDRDIYHRLDDSVVRVINGKPQILRRARGYAPTSLSLPIGFEQAPEILALGAELKNTFCLIKDGQAILSQHIGDLEDATILADYEKNLSLYKHLFNHKPSLLAIDQHPEYLSSKQGRKKADKDKLSLIEVQHHHAHIAACLAENDWPIEGGKVLGIVLDGLGLGEDGSLWGGEFLFADYHSCQRLGRLKAVALPGVAQAMHEPWRNTYAHLIAAFGWEKLQRSYKDLDLIYFFKQKPYSTLNAMLDKDLNSPLASSCGRLFDAVAAAIGICREKTSYEGQAAIELEALIDEQRLQLEKNNAYHFEIIKTTEDELPYLEPRNMWQALLNDLREKKQAEIIATRFHLGLANALFAMVVHLSNEDPAINNIVLSGGVFQNRRLFELVTERLQKAKYNVLSHGKVPANDGGLALGQAMVAAARTIKEKPLCV